MDAIEQHPTVINELTTSDYRGFVPRSGTRNRWGAGQRNGGGYALVQEAPHLPLRHGLVG